MIVVKVVNSNTLSIEFGYDKAKIDLVKKIPGRLYERYPKRRWTVPYTKKSLNAIKNLFKNYEVKMDTRIAEEDIPGNISFTEEILYFYNRKFAAFANWCLKNAPVTFFSVSATFNSNYYPNYAHGYQGLSKYIKAQMRTAYHSLEYDTYYSNEEKDIIMMAILLKDMYVYNNEDTKYKMEHPHQIVEYFEQLFKAEKRQIENNDIHYVYNTYWKKIKKCILAHHGKYIRDGVKLPSPQSKLELYVYNLDRIMSNRFIEFNMYRNEI